MAEIFESAEDVGHVAYLDVLVGFSELKAEMWKYKREMEEGQVDLEQCRKRVFDLKCENLELKQQLKDFEEKKIDKCNVTLQTEFGISDVGVQVDECHGSLSAVKVDMGIQVEVENSFVKDWKMPGSECFV